MNYKDFFYGCVTSVNKKSDISLDQLRQKYTFDQGNQSKFNQKLHQAFQNISHQVDSTTFRWADAQFLADPPEKARGESKDEELIYNKMFNLMGQPQEHLELVSAYFVPATLGTQFLTDTAKQDISVRVLTNSFLANDVPIVHAFYQKYRHELLASGVQLYEFKPYLERERRTWYEVVTGNVIPAKGKNASSLHAKFFDIDNKVFIGSFNFDPRSAYLNTEVGLFISSDELQNEISSRLNQYLPEVAYQVKLNDKKELIWIEYHKDGRQEIHTTEPNTTFFQRFMIKFVSFFPIEGLM